VRNPAAQGLRAALAAFAQGYWPGGERVGLYRPLVTLSYGLDASLGAGTPWVGHGTNLLLHALCVAGVLALLLRLGVSAAVALGAALLFAVHAVHTEVVANIAAGRPELLATSLALAALLLHGVGPAPSSQHRAHQAGALGLFVLALLSKESAVALPVLVLLLEWLPSGGRLATALRRSAPYWAVALAYGALRVALLGWEGARPQPAPIDNPLVLLAAPQRLWAALSVSLHSLGLLLLPLRLSYDYSYAALSPPAGLGSASGLATLALLVATAAGSAWAMRIPAARAGILLALAPYFVVSNWAVPIGTILGERLLYFPSIGFCLAAAALLERGVERLPLGAAGRRRCFALGVALVCGLHGLRALQRIPVWRSDRSLFLHDVRVVPGSAKAQTNAGSVLLAEGRPEAALAHFQAAIAIGAPGFGAPFADAITALTALGRFQEAVALGDRAFAAGLHEVSIDNNLGFLLVDRGIDVERGVRLLERAAAASPEDPEVLDSLGWGYFRQGRLERARQVLRRALERSQQPAGATRSHLEAVEAALRHRAAVRSGP